MSADLDDDDERGLAGPRTSLAWQRTGLTHMATGGACLRLLPTSTLRPVIAALMILAGAVISIGGRRMHPGVPHRRSVAGVCAVTVVLSIATAVLSFG